MNRSTMTARLKTLNPTDFFFLNCSMFLLLLREGVRETLLYFTLVCVNLPTVGRNWGNIFISEQPMLWIYGYYGPWFNLFSSICFSRHFAIGYRKNMIIIITQSHSNKNCIVVGSPVGLYQIRFFRNFFACTMKSFYYCHIVRALAAMTTADLNKHWMMLNIECWSLKCKYINKWIAADTKPLNKIRNGRFMMPMDVFMKRTCFICWPIGNRQSGVFEDG